MNQPLSVFSNDVTWRRVVHVFGLLLLIAVVGLVIVTSAPQLAGADESYVVLSDSMSPTIKAGAVVFVTEVPAETIQRGDIITYQQGGAESTITHRVIEVIDRAGGTQFVTQGDANEDPDPSPVSANAVVGTIAFHIPLIGYVISFANSDLGLLTLVVLPAGLLIVLEIRDLLHTDGDASEGEP